MSRLSIVTVASRAQLAHVAVVASSMAAAGVDARLRAVIVDDPGLTTRGSWPSGVDLVGPGMVDPTIIHQLRLLSSDGPTLASAVTPWVAVGLLAERRHPLLIVSPATWIAAPLASLENPSDDRPILVPTLMFARPAPGALGRGFHRSCLVLPPGADAFARWWAERTFDNALGLFGEGALDEAAASLSHDVARDPGLGVDAWNAAERAVRMNHGGLQVRGGRPLRTFHFDDFDPLQSHLAVGRPGVAPPVLLSENAALRQLHTRYASELRAAGYEGVRSDPYPWARLPGGTPVDRAVRHAFLTALRAHRRQEGEAPPDPFVAGGVSRLVAFLNEPAVESGGRFSRYVVSLYESWPGLAAEFPGAMTGDSRHFVWWLNRFARSDLPIPAAIDLPSIRTGTSAGRADGCGVNVAGYLRAASGLAVSAQRTIDALASAGVPVRPITYRRTMSPQEPGPLEDRSDGLFDVNIVCVTAEQFPYFRSDLGDELFADRYTIGYWYWELEVFSADQLGALDLVDEVWVATGHVLDAISPLTDKPVRHMPIPLVEPHPSDRSRASFGLPDGYLFLFAFDFNSVVTRKNPLAVVDAFEQAFPSAGDQHLVLKTLNAERWPAEAERIRCAIADRPDITMIDDYLTPNDQAALVAVSDCYVSLHRAEGLGLTLADAMALGKPVLATRYSGNLDFMDDSNSFLVPFTYGTVPAGTPAYPEGAPWAEPDVEEAARMMRLLVTDPEVGARVGTKARRDILDRWSSEQMGARMRARLEEVWSSRAQPRP